MSDDECPDCGSRLVRSAPYFAIEGELSDMRFTEAAGIYYANEDEYDSRTTHKFECGNTVVAES